MRMNGAPVSRRGEYATRGDYHRALDPEWEYYPTYLAKMRCRSRAGSPTAARDPRPRRRLRRRRHRRRVRGIAGDRGARSQLLVGPAFAQDRSCNCRIPTRRFDRALCLDVLEHLPYERSAERAVGAVSRDADRAVSCSSRCRTSRICSRACTSCCIGRLIRTASVVKHPGDRPARRVSLAGAQRRLHRWSNAGASFRPFRCSRASSAAIRAGCCRCTGCSRVCCPFRAGAS